MAVLKTTSLQNRVSLPGQFTNFIDLKKGIMMNYSGRLRICITDALKKFESIPEAEWNNKPIPAKWSKKEIIGHLIDSCHTNTRRFVVTQYEQHQQIVYKQNEWVEFQRYQQANHQDIIDLWRLMNMQLASTIDAIPANRLQNICITDEPHTIEWLIEDYIRHMNHHLQQITDL